MGLYPSALISSMKLELSSFSDSNIKMSSIIIFAPKYEVGLYHAYHRMLSFYETLANRNIVAKYNVQRLYLVL